MTDDKQALSQDAIKNAIYHLDMAKSFIDPMYPKRKKPEKEPSVIEKVKETLGVKRPMTEPEVSAMVKEALTVKKVDTAPGENCDRRAKKRKSRDDKQALFEDLIWKKNILNEQAFKTLIDWAKDNLGYHYIVKAEDGSEKKVGVKSHIYDNRESLTESKLDGLLAILEGRA